MREVGGDNCIVEYARQKEEREGKRNQTIIVVSRLWNKPSSNAGEHESKHEKDKRQHSLGFWLDTTEK